MDNRYFLLPTKRVHDLLLHVHVKRRMRAWCYMYTMYARTPSDIVRTVNTDVAVLAVKLAPSLSNENEFWITFWASRSPSFMASHERLISGSEQDTCTSRVSCPHSVWHCVLFLGPGKRSTWATWNTTPELTNAPPTLANAPIEIPVKEMQVIQ